MTAARRNEITHVVSTPAYLFDSIKHALTTSVYPLAEYSDYLRLYPGRKDDVEAILSMYNLRWHASTVKAETLLRADHSSGIYNPKVLADLENSIAGNVTVHESERSSYKDGIFAEKWLTEKLFGGDVKAIVPEHWRSAL